MMTFLFVSLIPPSLDSASFIVWTRPRKTSNNNPGVLRPKISVVYVLNIEFFTQGPPQVWKAPALDQKLQKQQIKIKLT